MDHLSFEPGAQLNLDSEVGEVPPLEDAGVWRCGKGTEGILGLGISNGL